MTARRSKGPSVAPVVVSEAPAVLKVGRGIEIVAVASYEWDPASATGAAARLADEIRAAAAGGDADAGLADHRLAWALDAMRRNGISTADADAIVLAIGGAALEAAWAGRAKFVGAAVTTGRKVSEGGRRGAAIANENRGDSERRAQLVRMVQEAEGWGARTFTEACQRVADRLRITRQAVEKQVRPVLRPKG